MTMKSALSGQNPLPTELLGGVNIYRRDLTNGRGMKVFNGRAGRYGAIAQAALTTGVLSLAGGMATSVPAMADAVCTMDPGTDPGAPISATATGQRSFACGEGAEANGDYTVAVGVVRVSAPRENSTPSSATVQTIMPRIENNMLRMAGHFPSMPSQVSFDLLFAPVDRQWRLYGISLYVAPGGPVAPESKPEAPVELPDPPVPTVNPLRQ